MAQIQPNSRLTTALVTGGGTGIGRALALALAQRGLRAIVTGRRRAPLESVVAEITARGGTASLLQTDLTQPAERAALLKAVTQLGPLDVLICNAGMLSGGPLTASAAIAIEQTIQLNLTATIELVRELRPTLKAVVMIGSQAGQVPLPYLALYSATKAGLMAFGEALRYEWPDVQVLIVAPPGTKTAMTAGLAQKAGWGRFSLLEAEFVGGRIVEALLAGRETVSFHPLHNLPVWLYRWLPGLVKRVLKSQRQRFAQMFAQ